MSRAVSVSCPAQAVICTDWCAISTVTSYENQLVISCPIVCRELTAALAGRTKKRHPNERVPFFNRDLRRAPTPARQRPAGADARPACARSAPGLYLTYFGMMTVSITWITPLSATMSVAVTLALSTVTPPAVAMVSSEP